jgi:hypothetical protein
MQIKSLFLLPVFILMMQSCGQNKTALLARTWRIEDLKYTQEIPEDMKPAITNWVNQMRESFTITYNADGTYYTQLKEQKLQGKWKLNWNSSTITSTAQDGSVKVFHVKELTETGFQFEAEEGGEKVIFIMVPATQ